MSWGGGGLKWPKESDIKGEGGQKWPQSFMDVSYWVENVNCLKKSTVNNCPHFFFLTHLLLPNCWSLKVWKSHKVFSI